MPSTATASYAEPVTDGPEPPRQIEGRLVRMGADEQAFDDAFWSRIPGEQKVEMLWDMVLEAMAVKGTDADGEPRLQRSVGRIVRP